MEDKEQIIQYAISYGEAIILGNSREANKLHGLLHNLYKKIKVNGNIDLFEELIHHADDNVKIWAATFLLPYKEKEAKRTLKKLEKSPGILSITAALTLDSWEKKELNLL